MKQQSTPRGEQPTSLQMETSQIAYNTDKTHPRTYYGFQNDSQDPFHQSRKPVSIELRFQVGIHEVSFAGRAESEEVVRTSHLCQSYSNSSAVAKAICPRGELLEDKICLFQSETLNKRCPWGLDAQM